MTGVPAFVQHDATSRDFTILETYDHSLVGIYPVEITTTIQVPNDYTKLSFTTHTIVQNFDIIVEPCQITSIDIITPLPDQYYQIGSGDPDLVSDQYVFQQNPKCGYPFTYSASVVPAPVTHDAAF